MLKIILAIEPEPCCVLETTAEVAAFFDSVKIPENLSPYIGLCLDCCHQAVEFENPKDILDTLNREGITIAKVQVSSALRAQTSKEISALFRFNEDTYLHQAVVKTQENRLRSFTDLPELQHYLKTKPLPQECRVHFHVPIFLENLDTLGTTRYFIEQLIPILPGKIPLEVETYSFSVLPENLQLDSVDDSILRELNWLKELADAPHRSA